MQTSLVSVIQERPAIKCTGLVVLLLVAAILVEDNLTTLKVEPRAVPMIESCTWLYFCR